MVVSHANSDAVPDAQLNKRPGRQIPYAVAAGEPKSAPLIVVRHFNYSLLICKKKIKNTHDTNLKLGIS